MPKRCGPSLGHWDMRSDRNRYSCASISDHSLGHWDMRSDRNIAERDLAERWSLGHWDMRSDRNMGSSKAVHRSSLGHWDMRSDRNAALRAGSGMASLGHWDMRSDLGPASGSAQSPPSCKPRPDSSRRSPPTRRQTCVRPRLSSARPQIPEPGDPPPLIPFSATLDRRALKPRRAGACTPLSPGGSGPHTTHPTQGPSRWLSILLPRPPGSALPICTR